MLLLIDNYDSFTYNLYQYLCELGADVHVVRNDKTTVAEIEAMAPERIVVSPGPRTPKEAGISVEVVRHFAGKLPLLGVCLVHQCIGEAFGGTVAGAGEIVHGKMSLIHHDGRGVLAGLPDPFPAIRYHSLSIQPDDLPDSLEVTAVVVEPCGRLLFANRRFARAVGVGPGRVRGTLSDHISGATALLEHSTLRGRLPATDNGIGLFEVDEAALPGVLAAITPRAARDQLPP